MEYLIVKWVHIVSAILLLGTGFGSAFYKFFTDRSESLPAMAVTNRLVVAADWLFTTPTIVIQPLTGIWMLWWLGVPWDQPWIVLSVLLYLIAGACWLPVVVLQLRMRELAENSLTEGQQLPAKYRSYRLVWVGLGIPAFLAMLTVTALMVMKPTTWSSLGVL